MLLKELNTEIPFDFIFLILGPQHSESELHLHHVMWLTSMLNSIFQEELKKAFQAEGFVICDVIPHCPT